MASAAQIVKQVDRLRGQLRVWGYLRERLETDLSDVSEDGPLVKLRVPQEHIDEIIEEVETALDEIKKELQELTGEEE